MITTSNLSNIWCGDTISVSTASNDGEKERLRAENIGLLEKLKAEKDAYRDVKEKYKALLGKTFPEVKKIQKNGDYMTVLWTDGTKTIVKRAEDEPESDYAAFTAAVAIRCFGSNSALKRIVASAEVIKKKKHK